MSQIVDELQTEVDRINAEIDDSELIGVVIAHPDRPIRYGTFPADTAETAIESALVVFELCERIVATEDHVVCVFPFGRGDDQDAIERDNTWGDMMSDHTNGKRMEPKQSIDDLMSSQPGDCDE